MDERRHKHTSQLQTRELAKAQNGKFTHTQPQKAGAIRKPELPTHACTAASATTQSPSAPNSNAMSPLRL